MDFLGLEQKQHFTQPPPRFTEASLIKALEENGIGRPSTYAPTLSTIQDRKYIRKEKGRIHPTELGLKVNGLLSDHFPDIVNLGFTAEMERELDEISRGEREWVPVIRDFYEPFQQALDKAGDAIPDEATGIICDKCGQPMEVKFGAMAGSCPAALTPHARTPSRFPVRNPRRPTSSAKNANAPCSSRSDVMASSSPAPATPNARNARPLPGEEREAPEETDEVCDKCDSPMVIRSGRRGKFLACTAYPKCKNTRPLPGEEREAPEETDEVCDKCESPMVIRSGRRGKFLACTAYPKCKNTRPSPARPLAGAGTNR